EQLEPLQCAERLIALANERGGEDNISVAVVHFGEQPATGVEPTDGTGPESTRTRRALWVYTLILAVIQTLLIILAYYIVAS
ncbi:MAG: hypothetical protein R3300_22435, partial [Candidatus Promineifilaceae bacterium]|nr:hypothetical protein [Candidatus Promineifilaceae bacterium]